VTSTFSCWLVVSFLSLSSPKNLSPSDKVILIEKYENASVKPMLIITNVMPATPETAPTITFLILFITIMLNVFALAAFSVIWLSISFIAFDIYKSGKNVPSAVSLAKISNILKWLVLLWITLLGAAMTTADNMVPVFLYILLFSGIFYYIYKLYGDILKSVSNIRKDDGSKKSHELIHSSLVTNDRHRTNAYKKAKFNKFRTFFWSLNAAISAGALINFWIMDTGGIGPLELFVASIMLVGMLQVLFLPIYFVVKKITFATLKSR